MKKFILLPAMVLALAGTTIAGEEKDMSDVEHLRPQAFVDHNLPFSAAVRVGNTLYLAGQVGTMPGTDTLIEGGIGPEARQTMENIQMVVEKYGSTMDHVVKCTVFLADISEWAAFNEVYVTFFKPDKLPARSAFGANGLALDARVEVECIAIIP